MLAEFGTWWLERMAELAAYGSRAAAPADTLLLRPLPGAVEALRRRRGRLHRLGRFALPGDARQLRAARNGEEPLTLATGTPPLRRTVTLPLAAGRGVATLLRYEMDRFTPFTAAEVLWDWRLLGRDGARGTLQAELWLLPRAAVAAPLQALAEAGLRPGMVEAALPDGGTCRLPLDPPGRAAPPAARRRQRAAVALCAALAVACLLTPLLREQFALAAQQARIAALRPLVAEAQTLQRRINGAGEDDPLAAGRARAADALAALAAITEALPDDTWLSQLSLSHRRLTLQGQTTGAATRLVAALAARPGLRDPAFSAPLLRGDNGSEMFALQVDLAP
jgi:general secretion pathway protein L